MFFYTFHPSVRHNDSIQKICLLKHPLADTDNEKCDSLEIKSFVISSKWF